MSFDLHTFDVYLRKAFFTTYSTKQAFVLQASVAFQDSSIPNVFYEKIKPIIYKI